MIRSLMTWLSGLGFLDLLEEWAKGCDWRRGLKYACLCIPNAAAP